MFGQKSALNNQKMIDIEDRHLFVIIDLINELVDTSEPLKYLSEEFNPWQMVCRICQLIVIYEKSIRSDSGVHSFLQSFKDCQSIDGRNACLVVRVWLLDYYHHNWVHINGLKLENGDQNEIILTTLMVLRILYQMRQLMDSRVNRILTNGWKDLNEFNEQLDQKLNKNCLHFMKVLINISDDFNSKIDSLLKQINCLEKEKKSLSKKLKSTEDKPIEDKPIENKSFFNHLGLQRITFNVKNRPKTEIKPKPELLISKTKSINKIKQKYWFRSLPSLRTTENAMKTRSMTTLSSLNASQQLFKPLRSSNYMTTRSTTIASNTPLSALKTPLKTRDRKPTSKKILHKIVTNSDTIKSEVKTIDDEIQNKSTPQSMALLPSMVRSKVAHESTNNLSIINNYRHWPSRNVKYGRKKRYPCDWQHCHYIADRPSTLVCILNNFTLISHFNV